MARSTQNSRSGRRFIARVIARASGVGRSPPMPLLEIGCFYVINALSVKLPAVHPALPRKSVGYVFSGLALSSRWLASLVTWTR